MLCLPKKVMPTDIFISRRQAVWAASQWVSTMLLWHQWPLKQSECWFEWITLGRSQITVTALRAVTFRFSGGPLWLVGRSTIKLCSVLGIHHHYIMGLGIGSLKDGSMTMGSSIRLSSCLGDTGSTWLHEAKVPLPVGWELQKESFTLEIMWEGIGKPRIGWASQETGIMGRERT